MSLIKTLTVIFVALNLTSCGLRIGEQAQTPDIEGFSVGCLNDFGGKVDLYLKGQLDHKQIVQMANCVQVALSIFKDRVYGQKAGEFTPQELRKFIQDLFLQDNIIRDKLLNQLIHLKTVIIGGKKTKLTHKDIESFIRFVEILKKEAIFFQPYFTAFHVLNQQNQTGDISQLKNIERALKSSINRVSVFFKSFVSPYHLKDMESLFEELDFFSDHEHNISNLKEKIKLLGALKGFVFGQADSTIKPKEWNTLLTAFAYLLSVHIHWTVLKKQKPWFSAEGTKAFSAVINDLIQFLSLTVKNRQHQLLKTNDFPNLMEHLVLAGFLPKTIKGPTVKSLLDMLFGKVFMLKEGPKEDPKEDPQKDLKEDQAFATTGLLQQKPASPEKAGQPLTPKSAPETGKVKPLQDNHHHFQRAYQRRTFVTSSDPIPDSPSPQSAPLMNPAKRPSGPAHQPKRMVSTSSTTKENLPEQELADSESKEIPITAEHISAIQTLFQLWTATQSFLNYHYDSKNPSELPIKASSFFSTPALWARGEGILDDILSMDPLYKQGYKIHLSANLSSGQKEALDYKNAKIYSFYRFATEMIKMGYKKTSPKDQALSQEELKHFFADFRPFAVNMGWMAPRSKTSVMGEGEAEFIAANILTSRAKGFNLNWQETEYLTSHEIVEYIAYAISFGLHLVETGPELFELCAEPAEGSPNLPEETSNWKNSNYNMGCVRLHLLPLLNKTSPNLPNFQKSVENMDEDQKSRLTEALIHISYGTEEQYQQANYINKENLKNIITALYFVETTITRYDTNKNLTLEHEEIENAFPTFKGYIARVTANLFCKPSSADDLDLVLGFYSYVIAKEKLPFSRHPSGWWEKPKAWFEMHLSSTYRDFEWQYWELNLDRTKLTSVFSILVKGLLSKKEQRKGQQCDHLPQKP